MAKNNLVHCAGTTQVPISLFPIQNTWNWNKLKLFYYVAQAGSITKAASLLNISQSALSRVVSDLEGTIDNKLFQRISQGMSLSYVGEIIYQAVDGMMAQVQLAQAKLISEEVPKKVNIATSGLLTPTILTHIERFEQLYPDTSLEIILTDGHLDLSSSYADVAILPHTTDFAGLDYETKHIQTLQLKLYASDRYLSQYSEPKTIAELKNHSLLLHHEIASDLQVLADKAPQLLTNSIADLYFCAMRDEGIVSLIKQEDISLTPILHEDVGTNLDVYLIYPRSRAVSPEVKAVLKFIEMW